MQFAKALLILALANALCFAEVEICGTCQCYQRFHADHTFCKSTDLQKCGQIFAEGVDADAQVEIVNLHNMFRSKVAKGQETNFEIFPQATNMLQMVSVSRIFTKLRFQKMRTLKPKDTPSRGGVHFSPIGLWGNLAQYRSAHSNSETKKLMC